MSDELWNFFNEVAFKERARVEENIRFNTERKMLDSLAPERWNELRTAIKKTLSQMKPLELEHSETEHSLTVNRYKHDVIARTLSLTFDPTIPRILWSCLPMQRKGQITFGMQGSALYYVADGAIRIEDEIIQVLLSCLAG